MPGDESLGSALARRTTPLAKNWLRVLRRACVIEFAIQGREGRASEEPGDLSPAGPEHYPSESRCGPAAGVFYVINV
jgi:hypothetical protein